MKKTRKAAERAGRELEDISIVAVTKNVDTEDISKAAGLGVSLLGETEFKKPGRNLPNSGMT